MLDNTIALELMTRFYVKDDEKAADGSVIRKIIASEVHLEEGLWFDQLEVDAPSADIPPELQEVDTSIEF